MFQEAMPVPDNNKKDRFLSGKHILFLSSFILILLILSFCYLSVRKATAAGARRVLITQDGETLYEFDLDLIQDKQILEIGAEGSRNIIEISPEGIGVIQADCPDQLCVRQGIRSHGPEPIVCLPHRLSIRFVSSADTETAADALDAVTGR